jgi:hypothetical protein
MCRRQPLTELHQIRREVFGDDWGNVITDTFGAGSGARLLPFRWPASTGARTTIVWTAVTPTTSPRLPGVDAAGRGRRCRPARRVVEVVRARFRRRGRPAAGEQGHGPVRLPRPHPAVVEENREGGASGAALEAGVGGGRRLRCPAGGSEETQPPAAGGRTPARAGLEPLDHQDLSREASLGRPVPPTLCQVLSRTADRRSALPELIEAIATGLAVGERIPGGVAGGVAQATAVVRRCLLSGGAVRAPRWSAEAVVGGSVVEAAGLRGRGGVGSWSSAASAAFALARSATDALRCRATRDVCDSAAASTRSGHCREPRHWQGSQGRRAGRDRRHR